MATNSNAGSLVACILRVGMENRFGRLAATLLRRVQYVRIRTVRTVVSLGFKDGRRMGARFDQFTCHIDRNSKTGVKCRIR